MIYQRLKEKLKTERKSWLVTGTAGFIGSHLLEHLLLLDQRVVGLDNFSTGFRHNLNRVREKVSPAQWKRFTFIEGDIRNFSDCQKACQEADLILHQAALGSVPRSIKEPLSTHESNVTGFVNLLTAAKEAQNKRFVYASSSAIYGDHPALPKKEEIIGKPLSPYAASKYMNEIYSDVFARIYGIETVGLRYFNVFGPRQDPNGAYAAVIPRWIFSLIKNKPLDINGTGETSRDFCFVENAVQANLLAALTTRPDAINQVYNVALNERTSLNQLYEILYRHLLPYYPHLKNFKPVYREFREGDILHSEADIAKAQTLLGFEPTHRIEPGLEITLQWFRTHFPG